MLIECCAELLPGLCELLFEGIGRQRQGIPFILEDGQERGYRGKGRGSRSDGVRGFEADKVFGGKIFVCHRIGAILGYISLDETSLEHVAWSCEHRTESLRKHSIPLFFDATGS